MKDYVTPPSLAEAISLLSAAGPLGVLKMGGCEVVPRVRRRELSGRVVVSLHEIAELKRLEPTPSGLRIGAGVRLSEIEADESLESSYPLLRSTVAAVGSPAIRNMASLVGNVAARLPDSDIVPVLAVLDAVAEIECADGRRSAPVDELTELTPGEVVTAILLPARSAGLDASYKRFAARRSLDKPIAAAACSLVLEDGVCQRVRLAFAGAGPVPGRIAAAEEALTGAPLTDESIAATADRVRAVVEPPTDRRASAEYRRSLLEVLTRRALEEIRRGRSSIPVQSG
jgi:CO/xanthine dehydrogenase FAD-binding subunit